LKVTATRLDDPTTLDTLNGLTELNYFLG